MGMIVTLYLVEGARPVSLMFEGVDPPGKVVDSASCEKKSFML